MAAILLTLFLPRQRPEGTPNYGGSSPAPTAAQAPTDPSGQGEQYADGSQTAATDAASEQPTEATGQPAAQGTDAQQQLPQSTDTQYPQPTPDQQQAYAQPEAAPEQQPAPAQQYTQPEPTPSTAPASAPAPAPSPTPSPAPAPRPAPAPMPAPPTQTQARQEMRQASPTQRKQAERFADRVPSAARNGISEGDIAAIVAELRKPPYQDADFFDILKAALSLQIASSYSGQTPGGVIEVVQIIGQAGTGGQAADALVWWWYHQR
jgi:hypothetical protein